MTPMTSATLSRRCQRVSQWGFVGVWYLLGVWVPPERLSTAWFGCCSSCFGSLALWAPGRRKVTPLPPPVQAHTPKTPEASASGDAKKPELADPR